MAKVGFYLRGARGKLAGAVFQRGADGATVAREIVKPKNPKTNGQMAQRMIFATATAAYSGLKSICDHSWEGVQYGSKSQQVFMKNALAMLRQRAANNDGNFLANGINTLMDNPYLVSKGSLSSLKKANVRISQAAVALQASVAQIGNENVITVKTFCEDLGIDKGDQITVIAISYDDDSNPIGSYAGNPFYRQYLEYARITVKADAADNDVVYSISDDNWGSAVVYELNGMTQLANNGIEFRSATGDFLVAAVIRSKKVGDQWLRSTETFTSMNDGSYKFAAMLPSWKGEKVSIGFPSDYILNNAETGEVTLTTTLTGASVAAVTNATPGVAIVVNNVAVLKGGKYNGLALVKPGEDESTFTFYEYVDERTVKETTQVCQFSGTQYKIPLDEAEQVLNYQLTVQPAD